jgi:hypothetical protein
MAQDRAILTRAHRRNLQGKVLLQCSARIYVHNLSQEGSDTLSLCGANAGIQEEKNELE